RQAVIDGVAARRELHEVVHESGRREVWNDSRVGLNLSQRYRQSIQRRLSRIARIGREEVGGRYPGLNVNALLGIEVNAPRAHIAHFRRVILPESVLYTQSPGNSLWRHLVDEYMVCSSSALRGDRRESDDAGRRGDSARAQEISIDGAAGI